MHVEARDYRPSSAFTAATLGALAALAGLGSATLGAGLFALVLLSSLGVGSVEALMAAEIADAPPEEQAPEVIEAAFVQLGRPFDPRELPDRQTATSSFAQRQRDPSVVSQRTREVTDAGIPPPNAHAHDTLNQLGNRAELFAPSNFVPETEGEATGSEEGRNSTGSLYAGQLYSLFRRGWSVPASIPDTELGGLRVTVSVVIGEDLHFQSIRITRRSGNADFDRSVESRLSEIRESGARAPEPPADERHRFINTPFTVNYDPPRNVRRTTRAPSSMSQGSGGSALDRLGAGY